MMKKVALIVFISVWSLPFLLFAQTGGKKGPPVSEETSACLGCHKEYTPGIVEDWLRSRHSKTMPTVAMKKARDRKEDICQESSPSPWKGGGRLL